jgi:uncharacterized HAD superfamily protein
LPLLSEICRRPVALQDLHHYDFKKSLGFDEEKDNRFLEQVLRSELLLYAPPMPCAVESISELSRHEIWIITSRPGFLKEITQRWLNDRKIKYDHIRFAEQGGKMAAGPKFDIFVEDYLEEARTFAEAGILTLLFNQPWNQADTLPENCRRVHDWESIVEIVNKLEGGLYYDDRHVGRRNLQDCQEES